MSAESSTRLHYAPDGDARARIVSDSGICLAVYEWSARRRHPFFHPLYSYQARTPLTCFAPWDHRWHKGLWWSWKFINDVNFWEDNHPDKRQEGISQVVTHDATEDADGSITIRQNLEMRVVATGEMLLTEARTLRLLPQVPGLAGAWAIDWDLRTSAPAPVTLRATPYPEFLWGGYGGLNYRPSRCMGWGEEIRNSAGGLGHAECHGRAARWAAYAGNLDGNESDSAEQPARAGVAIISHPANPAPTPFYTWSVGDDNRGFGFLAASPLMHAPIQLAVNDMLHLRYRVVLFDGSIPVTHL